MKQTRGGGWRSLESIRGARVDFRSSIVPVHFQAEALVEAGKGVLHLLGLVLARGAGEGAKVTKEGRVGGGGRHEETGA